ncbi:MAG TPA: hypothetical protein VG992_03460 [Candidatus Saccharimonadales bacterium]|nr:hypothetical protein [Candidatus Saccharimonadales bacterium]
MSEAKLPQPAQDALDYESTFGETASARSDRLLLQHGQPAVIDGEERLAYEWKVGWEYHRHFVLSRLAGATVTPRTVYHLNFEELHRGMGKPGRYDFSQADGIHETSEDVTSIYDKMAADEKGITVCELHQGLLLDYLASEERKDSGF